MNPFYRVFIHPSHPRYRLLSSLSARRDSTLILRENSNEAAATHSSSSSSSEEVKILSINRTLHSSSALRRYRSSSVAFWPLCNHLSLRNFHGSVASRTAAAAGQPNPPGTSGISVRNLGKVQSSYHCPPIFVSSSSSATRLISTFHRTGMMVWVSDYDVDPKVRNSNFRHQGQGICVAVICPVTNRISPTRGRRRSSSPRGHPRGRTTSTSVFCSSGCPEPIRI